MKRPAFQFYPADWRKDPALSTCSLAARGLWIELMCVMHESESYGVLSINGMPMTTQQIARSVGESAAVINKLMAELRAAGVFSVTENGSIYSRRMVKDERLRNVRAESGRLGGNPSLLNQKVIQKDNQTSKQAPKQIPTPSSSSSVNPNSSSLRSEELPPFAGKKKTFAVWLADAKAKGEKAISDYRPVWDYAERVGIAADWIEIAWIKFRDRYESDPTYKGKKYIDWRRTFLNAVEGNYLGLWWAKDGKFQLSTVGQQADLATREAA